jgi:hypothetical protein
MAEKKKAAPKRAQVFIRRNGLYTSGSGARNFRRGQAVDVIPGQKEDFTTKGISPAFLEILKFNKHV